MIKLLALALSLLPAAALAASVSNPGCADGAGRIGCGSCMPSLCEKNGCSLADNKCTQRDDSAGKVSKAYGEAADTGGKGGPASPNQPANLSRAGSGTGSTGPTLDPSKGPNAGRAPGDLRLEGERNRQEWLDRQQIINLPNVTNPNTALVDGIRGGNTLNLGGTGGNLVLKRDTLVNPVRDGSGSGPLVLNPTGGGKGGGTTLPPELINVAHTQTQTNNIVANYTNLINSVGTGNTNTATNKVNLNTGGATFNTNNLNLNTGGQYQGAGGQYQGAAGGQYGEGGAPGMPLRP